MRFSTATLLALPLLAAAAQDASPLEQAKGQAQYYLDKFLSYIPNPSKAHTPPAAAAKAGGKTLNILTLHDWEHTIRSSVKPSSTTPEEWWVLITGGNKTCFGMCEKVETAFNQTAALWSPVPSTPHLAYLNCEDQPVLCNAWGAGPPNLWMFEVLPAPAPVIVRLKNLNYTTTVMKDIVDLYTTHAYKEITPYEGWFHPFDSPLAKYGLAIPLGYFFWIFTVVPSWLFMILISFASRSVMSRRGLPPQRPAGGAAAPAPAAR
jgi:hypothetical protein